MLIPAIVPSQIPHPVGFSPSEISRLVNEDVVFEHARESAFLWTVRDRAIGEPHYSVGDLSRLDGRVDAHLAGLRAAGDAGWRHCKAALANPGAGEVFALSVLAFRAGNRDWMRDAVQASCASVETRRGLVSALGWIDFERVAPWIARLLDSRSPAHRVVGIAAAAVHRHDPGSALAAAIFDPDPLLRARALRAAGELKRHDVCDHVRRQLTDEHDECRFWAAWCLALNGDRDGVTALTKWFDRADPFGWGAMQLGLRSMQVDESRTWISSLVRRPDLARSAVMAVGIVGDPASIPWLVRRMESPELARLAGESFTMMTGADITYHDLDQDPPGGVDRPEDVDLDYESSLPWPSPERITRWWQAHQGLFRDGTRYLAGKPITVATVVDVLKAGKQRHRAAAALELALYRRDDVLFEVRARGDRQQQSLSSLPS